MVGWVVQVGWVGWQVDGRRDEAELRRMLADGLCRVLAANERQGRRGSGVKATECY